MKYFVVVRRMTRILLSFASCIIETVYIVKVDSFRIIFLEGEPSKPASRTSLFPRDLKSLSFPFFIPPSPPYRDASKQASYVHTIARTLDRDIASKEKIPTTNIHGKSFFRCLSNSAWIPQRSSLSLSPLSSRSCNAEITTTLAFLCCWLNPCRLSYMPHCSLYKTTGEKLQ